MLISALGTWVHQQDWLPATAAFVRDASSNGCRALMLVAPVIGQVCYLIDIDRQDERACGRPRLHESTAIEYDRAVGECALEAATSSPKSQCPNVSPMPAHSCHLLHAAGRSSGCRRAGTAVVQCIIDVMMRARVGQSATRLTA